MGLSALVNLCFLNRNAPYPGAGEGEVALNDMPPRARGREGKLEPRFVPTEMEKTKRKETD